MTWQAALDLVVARTGHGRYRDLCALDYRGHRAWRAEVIRMAGGPAPAGKVPLRDSIRATRLGHRNCWMSTKDSACGCGGVRCHLLGRVVHLGDCVRCLKTM